MSSVIQRSFRNRTVHGELHPARLTVIGCLVSLSSLLVQQYTAAPSDLSLLAIAIIEAVQDLEKQKTRYL